MKCILKVSKATICIRKYPKASKCIEMYSKISEKLVNVTECIPLKTPLKTAYKTYFEYFCTKNCILDLETRDEINISYRHDNVMVGIFVR